MNKNLMKPPEKEGKFHNLMNAAFPRVSALNGRVAPWSARAGIASLADLASLPGRAYVSIGRPEGESYMSALGRTEPRYDMASYQGEGDELAESILRDPTLPLGVGLGRLASGLGKVGRVALDALGNAGMTAGSQYATSGQVDPIAVAMAAGLGAAPHAMPGKAPVSRMTDESPYTIPRSKAGNEKFWSENQEKAISERYGDEGIPQSFTSAHKKGADLKRWMEENNKSLTQAIWELPESAVGVDLDPNSVSRMFFDAGLLGSEPPILTRGWRYGEPKDPNSSYNFAEQKGEPGVSLMEEFTPENRNVIGGTFQKFNAASDPVIVEGWLSKKTGSDGEPLIRGAKVLGKYPSENIKLFSGRTSSARQSTPIQALGNRLSAGAKQAVFRNLMGDSQNRGDTYYTKGGSR